MRLTSFTDYGLRILMRLASDPERAYSTAQIAEEFTLSRHHLAKVMQALAAYGYVQTRRGQGGGAMLARPASDIRIGDVVRLLERGNTLVECFAADGGACACQPDCRLQTMLAQAETQFIQDLNRHCLADCALPPIPAVSEAKPAPTRAKPEDRDDNR